MNDYERVARVIRHLDASRPAQPDLASIAARCGLSRHHFHRLFTRWAGVTPKDFLQCLTLGDARRRLLEGRTVLDAALDAGLSSPGRLHDLCVTLECATPGEIKSGGAGWRITVGFGESPFGPFFAGVGPRGICHLAFVGEADLAKSAIPLRRDWPNAELRRDDPAVREIGERVFCRESGLGAPPGLRAFVRGAPFRVRVWRALLAVPPGSLVSYGRLAAVAGNPAAARAAGAAVASNPLAYLIPCHRVIRETGILGGYRWGLERKRLMLAWEAAARWRASPGSGRRERPGGLGLPPRRAERRP